MSTDLKFNLIPKGNIVIKLILNMVASMRRFT